MVSPDHRKNYKKVSALVNNYQFARYYVNIITFKNLFKPQFSLFLMKTVTPNARYNKLTKVKVHRWISRLVKNIPVVLMLKHTGLKE